MKSKIVAKWAKQARLDKGTHGYMMLEAAVEEAFEVAAKRVEDSTEPGPTEVAAAIRKLARKAHSWVQLDGTRFCLGRLEGCRFCEPW